MKEVIFNGIFVFVICMLAAQTARSQGTVYLSNLSQPSVGSAAVGSDSWLAEMISTGNNPGGYELDSVQLAMAPALGTPSGFTVMLYSRSTRPSLGPTPGSSLGTLSGSSTDPVTAGIYTYTASGLTLSSSSIYFIVLTAGTPVASGAYAWSVQNPAPITSSGGWNATVSVYTSVDGLAWSGPYSDDPQFALTATAVPEPDTLYLLGLPGLLFVAWRRWRAKAQAR